MTQLRDPGTVRASVGALLVVVLASLGFVLIASHTTPTGYRSHPAPGHYTIGDGPSQPQQSSLSASPTGSTHEPRAHAERYPAFVLIVIEVAAFVAAVILLAGWLRGVRLRRRRRAAAGLLDHRELVVRLAAAADEGLLELQGGPVDDAIITCWLRLQDAAVEAGVRPSAADSPADFAGRVLRSAAVRTQPLQDLAELYREARFSGHTMTERSRTDAVRALLAIRADLSAYADG